ncbi:uncharacterized protein Z518_02630 [Rhinocladiella mackenziei CBS 650.93]|uniref:Oxoglutarate/iron-dependent oxygenase C-terminal degradation domain-containing protein n=1 Tax=Rhinocladiella mackenziei CBS 650.93 TaxID=1442369 RepID=A0A0D2IXC0_9EURO|nr:uncharacterized protein Z518_02630 [Rhinocladiella mackenziei CBS 650.93]KIX07976.1 hypothetical protein Z518_02630 [Rhinocladiella mackenziei CBS 650.93]
MVTALESLGQRRMHILSIGALHVRLTRTALVTDLSTKGPIRQNAIARRFRRGRDYALANPYQGDQPQLEFTISTTPSEGWESKDGNQDDEADEAGDIKHGDGIVPSHGLGDDDLSNSNTTKGKGKPREPDRVHVDNPAEIEFGGEEPYMAGDDDEDEEEDEEDQDEVEGE